MKRRLLASAASFLSLTFGSAVVEAQGFDHSPAGTRALGRGGAFAARGDDGTIAGTNPAALLEIPGYSIDLGSHLAFLDSCVHLTGSYAEGNPGPGSRFGDPGTWANQPYPAVCRSGAPGTSPNLMFTGHPIPELAFAVGVLSPGAVGWGNWGTPEGTLQSNGQTLPTPTRYALTESNILLFSPTAALAFRPFHWLRFGAAFQSTIALVEFSNFAAAFGASGDPGSDVRTKLAVNDYFVPAVVASVHVVPIDELDIVVHGRISDAIDDRGSLTVTTGPYGTAMSGGLQPYTTVVQGAGLHAGQPWQLGLAVRYAERIRPRSHDATREGRRTGRVEDHMQNERWDVELDATWQINSQVTDFVLTIPAGATTGGCVTPDGCPMGPTLPVDLDARDASGNRIAKQTPIPHGWKDQLIIRAGADWNILPGVLAARVGASFNSSGLSGAYQTQDFLPGMRLGIHVGGTWRIDRFDLSVAYAHIFQFDERIENGNFRAVAGSGTSGVCADSTTYDPNQPVTSRGCYPNGYAGVVNNGLYTADINVVSLQGTYHF